MSGLKYKLAHKRAEKGKWSATVKTQRKHLISFLKEMLSQLERAPVDLAFEYKGTNYKGEAVPIPQVCNDEVCQALEVTLNDEHLGIIHSTNSGWKMKQIKDKRLIEAIGNQITLWYK
jgi:hypothetical protein